MSTNMKQDKLKEKMEAAMKNDCLWKITYWKTTKRPMKVKRNAKA